MSDFLTNLAARAMAAPSLRPRTRSRFEPAADASPWARTTEQRDAIVRPLRSKTGATFEAALEAKPRLDTGEAADRDLSSPPASAQRQVIAAPPMIEKAGIDADADLQPSPRRRRPSRDRDDSEPEPQPSHDRIEQEVSRTVATSEHHVERVIEKRETTVRVRPADAVPTAEPPRADDRRHRYDEQPPRIEPQRHAPRAPFAIAEQRTPARQARTETPPAAPDPVIHVSIGRVEVRAVAAAPAPKRARGRTAPMTIEEYAARKAKGRP